MQAGKKIAKYTTHGINKHNIKLWMTKRHNEENK